jgi:hypothetical protein
VDPRTFGEVVVFDPANVAVEMPELARLGVDPIADGLDRATTSPGILRSPFPADQGTAAGPARHRRYRQHLLRRGAASWRAFAGIVAATRITPREITRLHAGIMHVLGEAIEAGGSTLADTQYVGIDGESRLVPAQPPCVRPCRAALHHLRQGRHRQGLRRRPRHPLLPPLPTLTTCTSYRFGGEGGGEGGA